MRHMARAFAALGFAVLMAGCRAPEQEAPASDTTPVDDVTRDPVRVESHEDTVAEATANVADLLALLKSIYGHQARLDAPWRDADGRDRQVCARGGSPDADAWPSRLAVCAAADAAGHPVTVDFFELERTPTGLHVSAQQRGVEPGATSPAIDVDIARFGRDRWGFLDHGGLNSEGTLVGWRTLRLFRAGRLEALATVNTTYDNNAADCDAPDCTVAGLSLDAELLFDVGDPDADFYPLIVHRYGFECGLRIDRRKRYPFDAGRFRYPVPEGPPDVACPPTEIP